MKIKRNARVAACGAVGALVFGLMGAAPASADSGHSHHGDDDHGHHAPSALFVSPGGSSSQSGRNCWSAGYSNIGDAVAAAPAGGVVFVCPGTYKEDVIVNKPLTLLGIDATVDATGLENAIQVVASHVSVSGFTLENANGEGLLVGIDAEADIALLPASGPVLSNDAVWDVNATNDDQGFNGTENSNCKYAGDCGGGIHLNGTTHAWVANNSVTHNADGILVTDDYAPTSYNEIVGNIVDDNPHECGIVLAGHNGGAVSFDSTTFALTGRNKSVAGIWGNVIVGNVADRNGTDIAPPQFGGGGSGSGIGLFGSAPGTGVYDNYIAGNEASGNGLAGYAMHAHLPGGEDINGNVVVHNDFGTNNVGGDGFDGPPTVDFQTTGIAVYSASAAQMVIADNRIHDDAIGIWHSTIVTVNGINSNHDHNVGTAVVTG